MLYLTIETIPKMVEWWGVNKGKFWKKKLNAFDDYKIMLCDGFGHKDWCLYESKRLSMAESPAEHAWQMCHRSPKTCINLLVDTSPPAYLKRHHCGHIPPANLNLDLRIYMCDCKMTIPQSATSQRPLFLPNTYVFASGPGSRDNKRRKGTIGLLPS